MTLQETLLEFDEKADYEKYEKLNEKESFFDLTPYLENPYELNIDKIKAFIIQSFIGMWEEQVRDMEALMENYITTYGTDKHNGQTEHFVEKLKGEIGKARELLANKDTK